jgi:prepilin-type N-terminal cleavage/methylation domain-containing protein
MTRARRTTTPTSCPAARGGTRPVRAGLPGTCAGFSLFELVIVVSVVGILAALAVPRYAESVGRYRAEAAARRVAADLALAQAKARAASAAQSVTFNATAGTYTVSSARNLDHPKSIYTVNLGGEPYRVTIGYADFGGTPQAQFDMFGAPTFGGKVTVYAGAYARTVSLVKEDGSVTVQ